MPSPRATNRRPRALLQLAALAAECVGAAADGVDASQREMEVCLAVAKLLSPGLSEAAWQWAMEQLPPPWNSVAFDGEGLPREAAIAVNDALAEAPAGIDPLALFYEHFLQALDAKRRTRHGVYYTPSALVRCLVRNVDRSLRDEFGLREGLRDESTWHDLPGVTLPTGIKAEDPIVRILDPALGAGLFLTEIVLAAQQLCSDGEHWNAVAPGLLRRLGGIEILPAAAAIAMVRLTATLQATGYRFAGSARVHLQIGDALAAPIRPPWTVIIGNPPFSGISANKHAWVGELLRGRGPDNTSRASYFDFAGAPMNERKHWLQDDYVKFLRIAHEQIETTGLGIVALVTSHGYLDNITFRALREKLLHTFPRISVIDLHGNAKRRERAPDGSRDENVFGIETGIALGIFRRPPGAALPQLERHDLWGLREDKLQALEHCDINELTPLPLPATNGHAFHGDSITVDPAYAAGWAIDAAMPLHTTAPVTARDAFVVADDRETLAHRCRDFGDRSLSDDEIRTRYFQRTRSRNHAAGDTRGWKLTAARAQMQTLDWRAIVQPVQYRPFDERVMLWADWLIDWPRSDVMAHLLAGDNLALITRRQAPPGQPWTYAWITDKLALDGVIRSDNRGSESLFPLWKVEPEGRRANFAPAFIAAIAAGTGLRWDEHGAANATTFTAPQLIYYAYALLHSERYRTSYQAALTNDFPRVLLPRSPQVFHRLAKVGERLAAVHLGHARLAPLPFHGQTPTHVDAGFPRYKDGKLQLNATDYFSRVSSRMWELRIGTYQVCQKLLKHWRNKPIDAAQLDRLALILARVRRSVVLQRVIDRWALRDIDFASDFVTDTAMPR